MQHDRLAVVEAVAEVDVQAERTRRAAAVLRIGARARVGARGAAVAAPRGAEVDEPPDEPRELHGDRAIQPVDGPRALGSAAEACGPTSIRAASPGRRYAIPNETAVTPAMTIAAQPRRRSRRASAGAHRGGAARAGRGGAARGAHRGRAARASSARSGVAVRGAAARGPPPAAGRADGSSQTSWRRDASAAVPSWPRT